MSYTDTNSNKSKCDIQNYVGPIRIGGQKGMGTDLLSWSSLRILYDIFKFKDFRF